MSENEAFDLVELIANTAFISTVDEIRPDAPRIPWVHSWRGNGQGDGLRGALLRGGLVRVDTRTLRVVSR